MGTLYRFELKKMLHQKVLWVAVLLMTVVLLGTGLADVIVGKAEAWAAGSFPAGK